MTRTPGNGERDRNEQHFWRQIFEATPAPSVIVRIRDQQFCDVNNAFVQSSGHTRIEAIGRTIGELGIWCDQAEGERVFQRFLVEHSLEAYETQLCTKTGKVVDALLYTEAIELDGEPCFVASIIDITERKAMEEALRAANQQLRVLSRRRGQIQEEERRSLSRELHDHIGQLVSAAKINVQSARRATNISDTREELAETARILDDVLEQTRQISFALRPAVLDDLGLAPAISSMLARTARATGITAEFVSPPDLPRADAESETACYRVAAEAVINAVNHASPRKIAVELRNVDNSIQLHVRDDGSGFEMQTMEHTAVRRRLGVIGMRERAFAVGGSFAIDSKPGKGTEVTADFPISAAPDSIT